MTCECIATMDKQLEPFNTRLSATIVFANPGYTCVTVKTEKIKITRDGQSAKQVLATFCPFCGVRYAEIVEVEP